MQIYIIFVLFLRLGITMGLEIVIIDTIATPYIPAVRAYVFEFSFYIVYLDTVLAIFGYEP